MLNWITLNKSEQLDDILAASHSSPQIIFKHSTSCSISSMAKARFDRDGGKLDNYNVYYLDLLAYRPISSEIADKFAVHHESPQVIVVHNGEVTYDESHLDIDIPSIIEHFEFLSN